MRSSSLFIFLLSFLTVSLSLDSWLMASGSTALLESAHATQLLAAQTQTHGNPRPEPGSKRRSFYQLQETEILRLL
ncbi:hypothetical protein H6F96_31090 [Microcoleus sp. FACHB-53]|nr:hypothetical protein [Microcoleus sp. FACHB-53]MBD2129795.1 hypothetical protein [Microcoleus sp. FACHB-1]